MRLVETLILTGYAAAMVTVCVTDLRRRIIHDEVVIALMLGAVGWWWVTGLGLDDIAWQMAIAGATFALFYAIWWVGGMGGGDVKLAAAIAMWWPFMIWQEGMVVTAVAGGIVTLAAWACHRIERTPGRIEVPYGIALAASGLWQASQTIS